MSNDQTLRTHVAELLRGGHAHASFDQAVENFPLKHIGTRPPGMPHSAWELLEHLRLAQNDILEFSRSADHVSPEFPEGYWPAAPAPRDTAQWEDSASRFREDLAALLKLVEDPAQDLMKPFPWGDGQTLLREALLAADHNSYHIGQLMLVRKALG